MKIGHTGRTRVEELILATVLIVIAVRTALPTKPTVYGPYLVKAVFAFLIAAPAVALFLARTMATRKNALLAVFITYGYSGGLAIVLDPLRFGAASALLGCGAFAGYLYFLTRKELKWIQQQSSPSSPPDPVLRDGSSSG